VRTITLEEHFASPAFLDGPGLQLKEQAAKFGAAATKLFEQLCDLGDARIAEMDAAGIDVQVLSLTSPGVEQLEATEACALAHESNDRLAGAIRSHPARFAGFAALPVADPKAAAKELERMVLEHGFKGAMINGHHRGRYLDDEYFEPLFAQAETLRVPVYLHPTQPPRPVVEAYYSGFSEIVTDMFAGAGWGWHIETAVHILRIILGGTFDRHPGLQIVIGHLGETLPFMLSRLDVMPTAMTKLRRPISAYLRENIYYTFSGFNFTATFLDLLLQVGTDRIMFSADYPYGSMVQARTFLDGLPMSNADKEKIAHGNAEQLFRM
jgi:uncharacterized protein